MQKLIMIVYIKDIFGVSTRIEFKFDEKLAVSHNYEAAKIEENKKIIQDVMSGRLITPGSLSVSSSSSKSEAKKESTEAKQPEKKREFQILIEILAKLSSFLNSSLKLMRS